MHLEDSGILDMLKDIEEDMLLNMNWNEIKRIWVVDIYSLYTEVE